MKAIDVRADDEMVVDKQGTIWIYHNTAWSYIIDAPSGPIAAWDIHDILPDEYEPYALLDNAARNTIKRGMIRS